MEYFLETVETIPEGVGFSLFGCVHILWLLAGAVIITLCAVLYKNSDTDGRMLWRKVMAILLLADEVFKMVILFVGGNYLWTYLPLHLCSINIFVVAWHAWKPSALVDNFLYTICIPGAMAALLFPSWASLPPSSAMHIHSFTVHILLVMYPLVLTITGDIRPDIRKLPICLGLLALLAIPVYGLNLLLDTNFMFLMYAEPGNPLYLFEQMWGNHLLGFPVIIVGVLIVMYVPILLYRKLKRA